jgi:acyl-CoA synthetase (AMP-forming)/AMP-acid ligase II
VDEVAVMGLDDIEWGQSVFALVALKPDWKLRFMNEDKFTLEDLKKWLRPRLPKHCMPKSFKKIDQIPIIWVKSTKEILSKYTRNKTSFF